jgi:hypothetical protein
MLTGMHNGVFCYTFKCPGNRSKFDELWARPDNTENMHGFQPTGHGRPAPRAPDKAGRRGSPACLQLAPERDGA